MASLAVLLAVLVSPPPLTVAVLVTLAGALLATFDGQRDGRIARSARQRVAARAGTGRLRARPARPRHARSPSGRRQRVGHRHRAVVGPAPAAWSPSACRSRLVCPCVNDPLCVFVSVRSAGGGGPAVPARKVATSAPHPSVAPKVAVTAIVPAAAC